MDKKSWRRKIAAACKKVGTYQKSFDAVIDTLAETMERRDEVAEVYVNSGAHPIITHVNKAGAVNPEKNPALLLWDDLNKSALAYWRDLGLTPAGLRKLTAETQTTKPTSALDKAILELSDEKL